MTNRRAAERRVEPPPPQRQGHRDREEAADAQLNLPVRNRPLNEVLSKLAKLVNINIHLDDEGLREEGLSPETPFHLELTSDIQFEELFELAPGKISPLPHHRSTKF